MNEWMHEWTYVILFYFFNKKVRGKWSWSLTAVTRSAHVQSLSLEVNGVKHWEPEEMKHGGKIQSSADRQTPTGSVWSAWILLMVWGGKRWCWHLHTESRCESEGGVFKLFHSGLRKVHLLCFQMMRNVFTHQSVSVWMWSMRGTALDIRSSHDRPSCWICHQHN